MTKYLPGSPAIVPQNKPGAASLLTALYMYNVAPRDGTAMATVSRSVPVQSLVGPEKGKFDARKLTWIGSISRDTLLCVSWHTSPVKAWTDMLTRSFSIGAGGFRGDTEVTAQALRHLLGAKIKLVGPYLGTSGVDLAMERGEVEGYCGYSWSTLKTQHADWLRDRKVSLLIQAALENHPDLPDVPALGHLIGPDQRTLVKLLFGTQIMARPFLAPPELPPKRRAALRSAFDRAMTDAEFPAESKRRGFAVDPLTGDESLMNDLYATPQQLLDEAASILSN